MARRKRPARSEPAQIPHRRGHDRCRDHRVGDWRRRSHSLADIYAYLRSIPPAPDFKTVPLLNGMMTTASTQR